LNVNGRNKYIHIIILVLNKTYLKDKIKKIYTQEGNLLSFIYKYK